MESLAQSFKAFKAASLDCSTAEKLCKDQAVDKFPTLRFFMADKSEYEDFTGTADCIEDCMELEAMSDFVTDSVPNVVVPVSDATFNNFLAPGELACMYVCVPMYRVACIFGVNLPVPAGHVYVCTCL
jgi:hypothetical protein